MLNNFLKALIIRNNADWSKNFVHCNGKVLFILPMAGNNYVQYVLKSNNVQFLQKKPVQGTRIDYFLYRPDYSRFKSAFIKKVLNPDSVKKKLLLIKAGLPRDISFDEYLEGFKMHGKSRYGGDKHFMMVNEVLEDVLGNYQINEMINTRDGFGFLNEIYGVKKIPSKRVKSSVDFPIRLNLTENENRLLENWFYSTYPRALRS